MGKESLKITLRTRAFNHIKYLLVIHMHTNTYYLLFASFELKGFLQLQYVSKVSGT